MKKGKTFLKKFGKFFTFADEINDIGSQLKKSDAKYRFSALLLLVLYLMIQTISVVHVHEECAHTASLCQDCVDHVSHKGHITQSSQSDFDCVLCKIIHTSYFSPEALDLSAKVLLGFIFTIALQQAVVCREVSLPNLRAPPVIG